MLHATASTRSPQPAAPAKADPALRPIAGGEAWIIPFEPGGPVWLSASAPRIAVLDQRRRARQVA